MSRAALSVARSEDSPQLDMPRGPMQYALARQQLQIISISENVASETGRGEGASTWNPITRLGSIYLRAGQFDRALAAFQQAIETDPKDGVAHIYLGWTLTRFDRIPEAIAEYRCGLEITSDNVALTNLGELLAHTNQWDEAVACFRKAVQLYPNDAIAHFDLGWALSAVGQNAEAISSLHKADEIRPGDVNIRRELGSALAAAGRFSESVAVYSKAIEENPQAAVLHCGLGAALSEAGHLEEAITAFRRGLAACPDQYLARNLAVLLGRTGDTVGAISFYRKAIELKPDYTDAYYRLGLALAVMNSDLETPDYSEAIAALKKATDLEPYHAHMWYQLGSMFALNKNNAEAITSFRQAHKLSSDNIERKKIRDIIKRLKALEKETNDNVSNSPEFSYNAYMPGEFPKARRKLPLLPKGLSWPSGDFNQSPHFGKAGGIARYLEEVWKPLIAAGVVDMPTLRRRYPSTAKAVDNHRRKLAEHAPELLPPVERELTDRAAAATPKRGDRPARLEWALKQRAYRARRRMRNENSIG